MYIDISLTDHSSVSDSWKLTLNQLNIGLMHIKTCLPFMRGTSSLIKVIPPAPIYCPRATSWKKIGMPQNIIATKYAIKKAPGNLKIYEIINLVCHSKSTIFNKKSQQVYTRGESNKIFFQRRLRGKSGGRGTLLDVFYRKPVNPQL